MIYLKMRCKKILNSMNPKMSFQQNKQQKSILASYSSNISIETTFMNTKNSKTNERHKFVLNLSQILYLKRSNKHAAYFLDHLLRKQQKNNKLKIVASTWNDEFELPDGFYRVSDCIKITSSISLKNQKTLSNNGFIHIYINTLKNRLFFKIKDGHKP